MHSRRGFSLVEILVAMVLLVGVTGLAFTAFSSSSKVQQSPNNIAANLGRSVIEQTHESVRGDQWNAASGDYTGGNALAEGTVVKPTATLNSVTYTPSTEVVGVDVNGDGIDDYKRVKTDVQW